MNAVLPQPKFAVGDAVWVVQFDTVRDRWPCPDCDDTREWTATTKAGEAVVIACPRCSGGGYSLPRNVPSLDRQRASASVRQLTVGSIRIDTAPHSDDGAVQYMCVETGVGSGSLYNETGPHCLYASEADALAAAAIRNAEEQAKIDGRPQALKAEAFARWPFSVSVESGWRGELWDAWHRAREYREAMERVISGGADACHCDDTITTIEEARDALREALEERPWVRQHPLDALLAAIDDAADSAPAPIREARQAFVYTPVSRLP